MATYDSREVREIANGIKLLVSSLEAEVTPGFRGAMEGMDQFRGKAAQAMEERLEVFQQSTNRLAREFEQLEHLANAYADRLEEIDQEFAEKL